MRTHPNLQLEKEKSLIYQAQRQEPGAFDQLYQRYFDRIFRYIASKVGNGTDAEDLTQQVFLKALEHVDSFNWQGVPFSCWLFRIAHNQVVDYVRKKNKERVLPLDEARVMSVADPVLLTEQKLRVEQLNAACQQLTKLQHKVIYLRFIAELPSAEVAQLMGKSEGAIKALQHSALKKLHRILRNERLQIRSEER